MIVRYYCGETYTDLVRYVKYGIQVGSFTRCLLVRDLDGAYRKANRLLVPGERGGEADNDVVLNMFELVEKRFPDILYGSADVVDRWTAHNGLADAPQVVMAKFLLLCNEPLRSQTLPG